MQTQMVQITWASVALDALKILGPAILALAGSWIALRYQRKLKEAEIDAGLRLKARELMFEAYQRELISQTAELKEFGKAMQNLYQKLKTGTQEEKIQAWLSAGTAMTGLMSPVLSSFPRLEQELREFGLSEQYSVQLDFIREALSNPPQITDLKGAEEFANTAFYMISHFTVMSQDLLDKKRQSLFQEYLPTTRAV